MPPQLHLAGDMAAITEIIEISLDDDLPPTSYDGSHLSWKAYREHVLGAHHISIVDLAPKEKLPTTPLSTIEAELPRASRFDSLKQAFREQVLNGRGFGPSPLFPPNLLPSINDEPKLARCMIPYFSREALPERAINQMGPLYELNIPRSGLGCGFSASAFTTEELNDLPSWLVTTGTIVHFDTGYISPGAAVYCPFLIFERAHGDRENRLEAANNQCATGGACCLRALQMLYAKAWKGSTMPDPPIAFSCVIENTFAVINIHWIDYDQTYGMAPLVKFDLTKDDHFSQFLVWVDSIGKWALTHLLPLVKTALERLRLEAGTPPATPRATRLTLDTSNCPNDALMRSLQTSFENIPWRFEDDDYTPVSSSTASWGSPMILNPNFPSYPAVPARHARQTPISAVQRKQLSARLGQRPTPPPAYSKNSELVWQKRFAHAMDEIRDLQRQMQALKNDVEASNLSVQTDLSGIQTTVNSVLRKETLTVRNRSLSLGIPETSSQQSIPRSPLVNEVRPAFNPEKAMSRGYQKMSMPPSPKSLRSGLPSPGLPSPGLPSPGMPSPTFSVYSENNVVMIPPAPPKSASFIKFASLMVSGHMIGVFIPNILLRVLVLGCITDVCMLAFASPHLPSSAEYLFSLWRSAR